MGEKGEGRGLDDAVGAVADDSLVLATEVREGGEVFVLDLSEYVFAE